MGKKKKWQTLLIGPARYLYIKVDEEDYKIGESMRIWTGELMKITEPAGV